MIFYLKKLTKKRFLYEIKSKFRVLNEIEKNPKILIEKLKFLVES